MEKDLGILIYVLESGEILILCQGAEENILLHSCSINACSFGPDIFVFARPC